MRYEEWKIFMNQRQIGKKDRKNNIGNLYLYINRVRIKLQGSILKKLFFEDEFSRWCFNNDYLFLSQMW